MDIDNTSQPALDHGVAPSGAALAASPRVRWRQRTVLRSRTGPAGGIELQAPQAAPVMACGDAIASIALADSGSGRAIDADGKAGGTGEASAVGPALPATRCVRRVDPGAGFDGPDPRAPRPDTQVAGAAPTIAGPTTTHATSTETLDAAPQVAPREIELWLLARRAQGATLRLDFELRTALARQVFRRDFVYVSRQVHALEASRRVQGLDRARLDDALATLRQRADTIEAFLAQSARELQAAIDAHGPASARIAFARPARFQATIVSPGAHRFLALLTRTDDTLARLEMAWLLGLVDPAARSTLVSDCRRALLGFKDLACDRRRAVGSLVQELNAQRRAGDAMRQEHPR